MGWVHGHGLPLETTYPYSSAKGKHGPCNGTESNATIFTISGHKKVPRDNETALAVAVARQPISIAIQANQPGFQHYKHGIFHGKCGDKTDHGVTLVGYGEYFSTHNLKSPWRAPTHAMQSVLTSPLFLASIRC